MYLNYSPVEPLHLSPQQSSHGFGNRSPDRKLANSHRPPVFRQRLGLRLLAFRNGLNVICRGGTRDWDVIHELLFAGSYRHALEFLRRQTGAPVVIDLGGNIGLFSLLAASTNKNAKIVTFEPGPPNRRLLKLNLLANSALSDQIQLQTEGVGGLARTTEWFFDQDNPGGSGLFGDKGQRFAVQIHSDERQLSSSDGWRKMLRPIEVMNVHRIEQRHALFDWSAQIPQSNPPPSCAVG